MGKAPFWDDLRTFDGLPWRGIVHIVSSGYPCQPFSIAGKQLGTADPRHLWPHVARIIGEVRPVLVFLENVPEHLRLGFREVAQDLQGMGYRVAAGIFSAAEVGAPHQRQRLFALAHAGRVEPATEPPGAAPQGNGPEPKPGDRGGVLAQSFEPRWAEAGERCHQHPGGEPEAGCGGMGYPGSEGLEIGQRGSISGAFPAAWPPGPADAEGWERILRERPDLTPAVAAAAAAAGQAGQTGKPSPERDRAGDEAQPALRRVADGLAGGLEYRQDQLRVLGNGVVPVVAAMAFAALWRELEELKR